MTTVSVSETEQLIRARLEATGQMSKLRAMVIDASLRAITADEGDAEELFAPGPVLKKLRTDDPDGLKHGLSLVVDYLQHLGLCYSANVVAIEAGFKPTEFSTKDTLADVYGVAADPDAAIIETIIATGGNAAAADAASTPPQQKKAAAPTPVAAAAVAAAPAAEKKPPLAAPVVATAAAPAAPAAAVAVKKPHPLSEDSTYIISRWNDREFVRINQVAGQQMNIDYLDRCKLFVLDPLDSTNVDDCNDCEMVFAACEGSIFLRNCHNCVVTAACKQLRTRDCSNMEIRLFAGTDPVVEASHHITFKPFNMRLPNLCQTFKSARLDPSANRYVHVYDFTAEDPKIPQPHFTVTHNGHGLSMVDRCAEHGTPECPPQIEDLLAGRLDPAASCESGQNKSQNIKTGASSWNTPAPADAAPPAEAMAAPPKAAEPAAAAEDSTPKKDDTSPEKKSESNYSSYSDYDDASDEDDKYHVDEDSDNF